MNRIMTDEQAVYGPYRAVECEWSHPEPCLAPVVPEKAYCQKHMELAYRVPEKKVKRINTPRQKINF